MPCRNFVVITDQAKPVANDLRDPHYACSVVNLPVDSVPSAHANPAADTVIYVERGTIEFMVGGAASFVAEGGFVRVPAGATFAYRNAGYDMARLLMRAEAPHSPKPVRRITLEFAA